MFRSQISKNEFLKLLKNVSRSQDIKGWIYRSTSKSAYDGPFIVNRPAISEPSKNDRCIQNLDRIAVGDANHLGRERLDDRLTMNGRLDEWDGRRELRVVSDRSPG